MSWKALFPIDFLAWAKIITAPFMSRKSEI